MAIAHVHTDTTGTSATLAATTSITLPTGVVSTDVVVVVFGVEVADATGSAGTVTPPTGWTRIGPAGGVVKDDLTNNLYLTAFRALGSVANLTFTNSGAAGATQSWVCAAFSGVDNTTPIDAAGAAGASTTGSATVTPDTCTTVAANDWGVQFVLDWLGGSYVASLYTVSASSTVNAAVALMYNQTAYAASSNVSTTITDSAATTGQILVALSCALKPAGSTTIVEEDSFSTITRYTW